MAMVGRRGAGLLAWSVARAEVGQGRAPVVGNRSSMGSWTRMSGSRWRAAAVVVVALAGLSALRLAPRRPPAMAARDRPPAEKAPRMTPVQRAITTELERQIGAGIVYRGGYYDGGDPPPGIGVCTDVVVRAFRAAGIDLRRRVADDIRSAPDAYGLRRPDPGIDHRRCRNLIAYFRRRARELPTDAEWEPGDVVFWRTRSGGPVDHVGMIGPRRDGAGSPYVVHHWPHAPVTETADLHSWTIVGHFRWDDDVAGQADAGHPSLGHTDPAARRKRDDPNTMDAGAGGSHALRRVRPRNIHDAYQR